MYSNYGNENYSFHDINEMNNEEYDKIFYFNNNKNFQEEESEEKNANLYFNTPAEIISSIKNKNIKNISDLPTKVTLQENLYANNNKEPQENSNNNDLLGKKQNRTKKTGNHNKYTDDNLRRKCKHIVLSNTFNFINEIIKKKYDNNIGKGVFVKQLLTINQKQKSDATIRFNKEFLNKTLKDIFSENISTKFSIFPLDHNQNLINYLMNEEDEDKKTYFRNLFNLTFLDCLNHFRGSEAINELEGLTDLNTYIKKYDNEPEYLETLKYYLLNYDSITNNKRHRNRKKKEKVNDLNSENK